jgi:uncharacterized protein YceK
MKKYCLILIMVISMSGCAGLQKKTEIPKHVQTSDQEENNGSTYAQKKTQALINSQAQARNLDTAKKLLQENKISAATDVLVNISSAKGVPGVTDEALFRLALLYLDGGQGKNDVAQAQSTLEKLMKEYPTSSWKKHSDSLIDLIAALNRKIKHLKGENLSLTKENKELRLNIEKLKILDIEQDLKVKR